MTNLNMEGLIPLLGGAYGLYVAVRPAPAKRQGEWEIWQAKYGRLMKIAGPMLMVFGLVQLLGLM